MAHVWGVADNDIVEDIHHPLRLDVCANEAKQCRSGPYKKHYCLTEFSRNVAFAVQQMRLVAEVSADEGQHH